MIIIKSLFSAKMGRSYHAQIWERHVGLKLHKEGKNITDIAENLGRSRCFVRNLLKAPKIKETRGRKRKTSATTDRYIANISKTDPFKSSRDIVKEISENVSSRTVRRRLGEANLFGRSARKVPLLSKLNIKQRLKFAESHETWINDRASKWRNILWTDETKINLFGSDGRLYVRRPPNQAYNPKYTKPTVKHGGGNIMVWGCFSWNGVGPIHWIKERMTADVYIKILDDKMYPWAEDEMPLKWTFQQDNDPKHTSKKAKEWFLNKKMDIMVWPSQSPDLNPIENLWKDVKNSVGAKKIKNRDHLWSELQAAWYNIPIERCRNLIRSMPNRCAAVKKAKGYSTKY